MTATSEQAAAVDDEHAPRALLFQRGTHQAVVLEHLERGSRAGKRGTLSKAAEHGREYTQASVDEFVFVQIAQVSDWGHRHGSVEGLGVGRKRLAARLCA